MTEKRPTVSGPRPSVSTKRPSSFEPNLYAVRDNNRKPWWIVAVRSLPEAQHTPPINEWRLCVTPEERGTFGVELLQKHGTNGVHFCVAEGYWNIDG